MRHLQFALVSSPCPVFNTCHLERWFGGQKGDTLHLDDQNLLRCVETVLLPDSKVELLEFCPHPSTPMWKIRTREYPFEQDYYIHEKFLHFQEEEPSERIPSLLNAEALLDQCKSLLGTRYIWGGNWPQGITSLPQLHPPAVPFKELSPVSQEIWTLKGVDCSGLLYFISNGYTPRQTSSLVHFGEGVPIADKSIEEIAEAIQPLDIIVWPGHILIALDRSSVIESINPKGVVETNLKTRLGEILEKRSPIDDSTQCGENHFVVRRWLKVCR